MQKLIINFEATEDEKEKGKVNTHSKYDVNCDTNFLINALVELLTKFVDNDNDTRMAMAIAIHEYIKEDLRIKK